MESNGTININKLMENFSKSSKRSNVNNEEIKKNNNIKKLYKLLTRNQYNNPCTIFQSPFVQHLFFDQYIKNGNGNNPVLVCKTFISLLEIFNYYKKNKQIDDLIKILYMASYNEQNYLNMEIEEKKEENRKINKKKKSEEAEEEPHEGNEEEGEEAEEEPYEEDYIEKFNNLIENILYLSKNTNRIISSINQERPYRSLDKFTKNKIENEPSSQGTSSQGTSSQGASNPVNGLENGLLLLSGWCIKDPCY